MELSDLVAALRRRRRSALITFLIVIVAVGAIAVLRPKSYSASETLLVEPTPGNSSTGGIQVVQFLISALPTKVGSQNFHNAVAGSLPPALGRAQVTISGKSDQATGLLTISVTGSDRNALTPWANTAGRLIARTGTSSVPGAATIVSLNSAREPASSSGDIGLGAGGLVGGAILAVLVAVIVDSVRSRSDRRERIQRRYGIPVLAAIPRTGRLRSRLDPELIFRQPKRGRQSDLVEALEAAQLGLTVVRRTHPISTLAVVSRSRGEGKTTLVASLAWMWAATDRRVVAVDANLRRPRLNNRFGSGPVSGSLDDPTELSGLSRPSATPNLHVITSAASSRHPAEVITTNLWPVMEACKRTQPDLILVDSPALEDAPEAAAIAVLVDAVILVVDERQTSLQEVGSSLSGLDDLGATVVGIVLNHHGRARRSAPVRSRPRGPHTGGPAGPQSSGRRRTKPVPAPGPSDRAPRTPRSPDGVVAVERR